MEVSIRFIGKDIIEMKCEGLGASIIEDITSLDGVADVKLINQLEEVAQELRDHNAKIKP